MADVSKIKLNGTSYTVKDTTARAIANAAIPATEKGISNGVVPLNANGKIDSSYLPSYVDEIIEGYYYNDKFYKDIAHTIEITGESSKIYISLDTNKIYRYSGTTFIGISSSLSLGETAETAYYGDKGKIAYNHSQISSGNPHGITKSTIDLNNVENKSSAMIRDELTLDNINMALGSATITISGNVITFS